MVSLAPTAQRVLISPRYVLARKTRFAACFKVRARTNGAVQGFRNPFRFIARADGPMGILFVASACGGIVARITNRMPGPVEASGGRFGARMSTPTATFCVIQAVIAIGKLAAKARGENPHQTVAVFFAALFSHQDAGHEEQQQ